MFITLGAGNITAKAINERIFTVFWMLAGVCLYAYIVASMQALFKDLYQKKSKLKKRENFYLEYARTFDLPKELIEKIFGQIRNQYLEVNTNKLQNYLEEGQFLQDLPISLYGDILK